MPGKPITKEGIEKDLSYIINGTYVSEFLERIQKPRPGLEVLEAGCGSGKLGLGYFLGGAKVWMIDIDPGVIAYAEELRARLLEMYTPVHGEAHIEQGSIFKLSENFKPVFDLVFSEGTTHHWPREDPRRAESIRQMVAVAKPGGLVVVVGSNAYCKEMMDYAERVHHTYADMPSHQTPLLPGELINMLSKVGVSNPEVIPIRQTRLVPGGSIEGSLFGSKLIAGWGRKE